MAKTLVLKINPELARKFMTANSENPEIALIDAIQSRQWPVGIMKVAGADRVVATYAGRVIGVYWIHSVSAVAGEKQAVTLVLEPIESDIELGSPMNYRTSNLASVATEERLQEALEKGAERAASNE